MANATKQQALAELHAEIKASGITPELAQHATQLVPGFGNPNASIVFIGEAPGAEEDLRGEPFVGRSGKLLDAMLAQIGMTRSDAYITNAVKYRPLNNRDPQRAELQAFLPYLQKELAIIEPKLIVTLGRISMDVLLPGLKISQVHGKTQYNDGQAYLPMFHPSYIIRWNKYQMYSDDFAQIPTILKTI